MDSRTSDGVCAINLLASAAFLAIYIDRAFGVIPTNLSNFGICTTVAVLLIINTLVAAQYLFGSKDSNCEFHIGVLTFALATGISGLVTFLFFSDYFFTCILALATIRVLCDHITTSLHDESTVVTPYPSSTRRREATNAHFSAVRAKKSATMWLLQPIMTILIILSLFICSVIGIYVATNTGTIIAMIGLVVPVIFHLLHVAIWASSHPKIPFYERFRPIETFHMLLLLYPLIVGMVYLSNGDLEAATTNVVQVIPSVAFATYVHCTSTF